MKQYAVRLTGSGFVTCEPAGASGHRDQPASFAAERSALIKGSTRHTGREVHSGLPDLCDSQGHHQSHTLLL